MNLTLVAFFFIILVIILSVLRSRLVFEFVGSSLLIFGSQQPGLWLYSLLFLPGTILHELSHWLVAEILQVKTGAITILPDLDSHDTIKRLGSVATASSDPIRGFFIGIAPFISGLLTLSLLGYFLLQTTLVWWQYGLLIYATGVVGSSMLLSAEDRRHFLPAAIFFVVIFLILHKLSLLAKLILYLYTPLTQINFVLMITVLVILVLIGILYLLRRIIEQLTHKKLARR